MTRGRSLAFALLLCGLTLAASAAAATAPLGPPEPVLRVGVVDGAQPCSDERDGQWHGLAVELWTQLASAERLPFVLESRPSAIALLNDV